MNNGILFLSQVDKRLCVVCRYNKRGNRNRVICSDQACKITWNMLPKSFLVRPYEQQPSMGANNKYTLKFDGRFYGSMSKKGSYEYDRYKYDYKISYIDKLLKEVKLKEAILSRLKTIDQIKDAMSKEFCRITPYQIQRYHYEEQQRTIDAFRGYDRFDNVFP